MKEYYAIYDTDEQKYFVTSVPPMVEWSCSELLAK